MTMRSWDCRMNFSPNGWGTVSAPSLSLSFFVLGEHSLALSRQIRGVNLQTLAKSALVSGQLPTDGWWNRSDFLAPAGQKSPTETVRISNKTVCFASRLPSYYLSFMPLIQTTEKLPTKTVYINHTIFRPEGRERKITVIIWGTWRGF